MNRPLNSVLRRTGRSYFAIAFLARLPYSMVVVGVLTLVVAERDSILFGGLNSAAVGAGVAIFGPVLGALADHLGQRQVLVIYCIAHSFALCSLAYLVASPLPNWTVLFASFLVGASAPQASPLSRARLVAIITDHVPPNQRDQALNGTMAFESATEELAFVLGPVLVGVLAVLFSPAIPIFATVLLTITFVGWFALHPTASVAKTRAARAATLAPISHLFSTPAVLVVAASLTMGVFFGSMLTSLTAFLQELGKEESAGLFYGAMSLGATVLALAVASFPPAFRHHQRWLAFGLTLLAGTSVLQFVTTSTDVLIALLVSGLGVGPVLVTLFSLGAQRSPMGRSTTLMAMMGSAIIVGQSFSAAFTGWLSETLSPEIAFAVPLVASLTLVTLGIVDWLQTRGKLKKRS